ncbi:MAG: leucyl aminopeptidase [Candidatus Doudnabacteria bacterium]|nr:leucyl aminopeptidase [Candidatus Doudnabacteria bacterium]
MIKFDLLPSLDAVSSVPSVRVIGVFAPTPSKDKKQKADASFPLSSELKVVDKALGGFLAETIEDESFQGTAGQTLLLATNGVAGAKRVLLVGLGQQKTFTLETLRRACGTLAVAVSRVAGTDVVAELPLGALPTEVTPEQVGEAITVGAMGATYKFLKYKQEDLKKFEKRRLKSLTVVVDKSQHTAMKRGFKRGTTLMEAVFMTRDTVNEPASVMTPDGVKKIAESVAKLPNVSLKVMGRPELKKLGAGAHLAVAQGSDQAAYLLHLTYKPKKATKKIVLVGKGITFDSGGLSLKPADYMMDMKDDLTGSATVIATLKAIAELKLPVEVHALAAMAENMPSGKAMRPGDVVTAMNGKTIEILNTDAEGRLVLADALSYASAKLTPDAIFDVATLTGAAMHALGHIVAPFMGTDDSLNDRVREASDVSGELLLELPLVPEYAEEMKGQVSDLRNIGTTPYAGTVKAAHFLHAFVGEGIPWVHFDIAGPAFTSKRTRSYNAEGGTGFLVRTLVELVESFS